MTVYPLTLSKLFSQKLDLPLVKTEPAFMCLGEKECCTNTYNKGGLEPKRVWMNRYPGSSFTFLPLHKPCFGTANTVVPNTTP